MQQLVRDIDVLLRGGFTKSEDLAAGRIRVPAGTLVRAGLVLGGIAGACTGLYALLRPDNASFLQVLATTVKVPLLFLLTLAVTLPSLYVFSALSRASLQFKETMRLLLAAITVNLALLASFGPVTAFFTLSTDSYPFMVLLNVAFFAASGFAGLTFLRRALEIVFRGRRPEPPALPPQPAPVKDPGPEPEGEDPEGESEPPAKVVITPKPGPRRSGSETVFRVWIVIYGIVGAQMGWILRPFIGSPDIPFTWFRPRESSFFGGVLEALRMLLT